MLSNSLADLRGKAMVVDALNGSHEPRNDDELPGLLADADMSIYESTQAWREHGENSNRRRS